MNLFPKPPSFSQLTEGLDTWPNWIKDEFQQRAINVKWFGAKGNDTSDDYNAFLSAVQAVELLDNGVLYIPPGYYRLSGPLKLEKHGTKLVCHGVLRPYGTYSGYLVKLIGDRTSRDSVYPNNVWQAKIDIDGLNIDGCHQAKGLYCERLDHFEIKNVLMNRILGNALRLKILREGSFSNVNIAMSNGVNEPVVDIYDDIPRTIADSTNNIYFINLNVVYSGGQNLKIHSSGEDVANPRHLYFIGGQIHYLDSNYPWSNIDNTVQLIEIERARNIFFLGTTLRLGMQSQGTTVSIGKVGFTTDNIHFTDCIISGEGTDAKGISITPTANVSNVSTTSTYLAFPNGVPFDDPERKCINNFFNTLRLYSRNGDLTRKTEIYTSLNHLFFDITDLNNTPQTIMIYADGVGTALYNNSADASLNLGMADKRIRSIKIAPLGTEPHRVVGNIVMADGVNWDPAEKALDKPYLVCWDGTSWQPLW